MIVITGTRLSGDLKAEPSQSTIPMLSEDVEIEELVLYGDVEERLRRAKVGCGRAYDPREIPPEQV
jgi:hypothetical protein